MIWLDNLRVFRHYKKLARYRILNRHKRYIGTIKLHEKVTCLYSEHYPVRLQLMPFPQVPRACIAEVCARRVCDQQIPSNNMRCAVHCGNKPRSIDNVHGIVQNMPLWVSAGRLLNVAEYASCPNARNALHTSCDSSQATKTFISASNSAFYRCSAYNPSPSG